MHEWTGKIQQRWTNLCYQKVGKLLTGKVSFCTCFMKWFGSRSCGNECVKYSGCSRGCTCPAWAGRDASHSKKLSTKENIWPPKSHCILQFPLSALCREFPHSRESPRCYQQLHSEKHSQHGTVLESSSTTPIFIWTFNLDTEQVPSVKREQAHSQEGVWACCQLRAAHWGVQGLRLQILPLLSCPLPCWCLEHFTGDSSDPSRHQGSFPRQICRTLALPSDKTTSPGIISDRRSLR